MTCDRCGEKGIRTPFEIRFAFPSGNGLIFNVCDKCSNDIEQYIKKKPCYNVYGYNLNGSTDYNQGFKEGYHRAECDLKEEESK